MNSLISIARFQRIGWMQPSVIALLLANLVPLVGVFVFHWEVFPLLFLFWLENVVIGIVNVLKMLFASSGDLMQSLTGMIGSPELRQRIEAARQEQMNQPGQLPPDQIEAIRQQRLQLLGSPAVMNGMKIFLIPFFCIHYGMFTMVHGMFIIALFGGGLGHMMGFPNPGMAFQIIRDNHLALPLAALVVSHLVSFGYDYLWRGEYRRTNVAVQMMQPYGRIVVMHMTIIFGGFVMMALKSPAAGLVLLVVLKMILDLAGFQRERDKLSPPAATNS